MRLFDERRNPWNPAGAPAGWFEGPITTNGTGIYIYPLYKKDIAKYFSERLYANSEDVKESESGRPDEASVF